MLSRHERDRLAEIESGLLSDDPRLAEKFERFDGGRDASGLWRVVVVLALALAGALVSVLLVSGQLIAAAVVGALAVVGGAVCCWRAWRRPGASGRT
ncbi:DUF3040 domain-containing protein [Saccharopolyspora sp. HNM0983]|uniref:DUF3040 domain-containing protein n=1 Tax=Saccharopolyspora montiporae TaxID=2781240 RepID=A0A929G365_9PSEU|nr:DUF3040 domain-containing protein [Saccharopolyspora sp. HNM0983]MBE9376583.1 DUF3040 domain-containing protein [Saccharopolyspora sp. HNM0983]